MVEVPHTYTHRWVDSALERRRVDAPVIKADVVLSQQQYDSSYMYGSHSRGVRPRHAEMDESVSACVCVCV